MFRRSRYLCSAALVFALLSMVMIILIRQNLSYGRKLIDTAAAIGRIDTMSAHRLALKRYQQLETNDYAVKIRIMRRRWSLLLALRPQLRTDPTDADLRREFDSLRTALQEAGEKLLQTGPPTESAWRIHNLLGAGYFLQAEAIFATGEAGENIQQGRAALNLAISHFKTAITMIDQSPADYELSNIPRWNLELLTSGTGTAQPAAAISGGTSQLNLKKNLSTMLPESAGFMVGEPPDNRVRK